MEKGRKNIESLDHDTLSLIFSYLGLFDLVRSSFVSKSWNLIINKSRLLHSLYCKQLPNEESNSSIDMGRPLSVFLEAKAMEHHRSSLVNGSLTVDQWRGHTTRIDQCRMKRGLILSGVGDKVMRLWSSYSYKCLEEYSLSDLAPLVDFDFDESKVVGLAGTRMCIWRRHGQRSVFQPQESMSRKGLCMRYMDPEALVGCDDGTVRVFDMYSKKCSQIIRMHSCQVNCLALGEDQLVVSGSSQGDITVSYPSSNKCITALNSHGGRIFDSVKTLCYNPSSHKVFAGSISGLAACWDLRFIRNYGPLWWTRVSPNAIYSMQRLQSDKSTLVVGGVDGVLRIVDQDTGMILTRCVMDPSSTNIVYGLVERKNATRLAEDACIGSIPYTARSPIKCLAVGMGKVVTTHNTNYIRMWKFHKSEGGSLDNLSTVPPNQMK